jgi:hypothetical protein
MRHCRFAGYAGDQIKAAGQEGIVESASVPIALCGGRPAGDAMAPMCGRGFGPSMGALLPRPAGGKREREYVERSRKTPQIEREAK